MRTATVTWITYHNYGTFLQAYALQQVIKKLGFSNSIIDDQRIVMPNGSPYDYIYKLNPLKRFYIFLNLFLHRDQWNKYIQDKRFDEFKNKYLTVDNDFNTFEDLNDKYDVFIAGSDQIWNPVDEIFKPYYYLDFASKKKISYAPSLGVSSYPGNYKSIVRNLLHTFSHISVRENIGKSLLESFINDKKIKTVLDPTLLLKRRDWDNISTSLDLSHNEYILCYMLTYNEKYLKMVRYYADQRNKKLIFLATNEENRKYADKILNVGPSGFVSAIKNAKLVLTDSFHAVAFSIIYGKDFYVFQRFSDSDSRNQNSRIYDLLKMIGLNNRLITEQMSSIPEDQELIDFARIERVIEEKRIESIKYLKDSLLN